MNNLVTVGLLACSLLALVVIAYLVRALNEALRRQQEQLRAAPAASSDLQPPPIQAKASALESLALAEAESAGVETTRTDGGSETPSEVKKPDSETDARGLFRVDNLVGVDKGFDETNIERAPSPSSEQANASELSENDIYALARSMDDYFNQSAHPKDLMQHERFERGVELLRSEAYTPEDLLSYSTGANTVLACMALEALARRTDARTSLQPILESINTIYWWPRFYALRAIDAQAGESAVVADLLVRLDYNWTDSILSKFLREFVNWRTGAGERIEFDGRLGALSTEQAATLAEILDTLKDVLPEQLSEELAEWRGSRVDTDFLKSFGRVWEAGAYADDVVMLDVLEERVRQLETTLGKEPPRSVMLVGERGTGKTTLVRALSERLQREGWTIFEASAADIIAGQMYIGQIEGRVQSLIRQIGGKRVVWFIPNFQELMWAGRHENNPTSVLDQLLPQIESGQLKVVGETSSVAYEKLSQLKPQLRNALETFYVHPLGDEETLKLARLWARLDTASDDRALISEETLQEAFQLARQYLADRAAPGNLLQFLDSARRRLESERGASSFEITLDDLLFTLSQLTGLPVQMLDERSGLDIRELRSFFDERVLGQPEAIECLVERVAMIKAGLTDPTRPQGVFLFVGPTGTGKTEIAKTLAEFLFGSSERMIRLDMSEFQTPDSLDRILGDTKETSDSTALVNAIRKQPFSVVLLDEFEKANPNVWDLFLQVFDDGRLTDRRGNTADFRHCVVIMTSNLGATLPHGAGIGFSQEQTGFASASVERAVARTFRSEFINRIDRVVVFRPLGRAVMRELLRKELNDVLRRRGLRTRAWAVEWDESAIEFLLQRGFTPDLGARPLKRAIERYLLAPLAITIVNHQFPEGDQFLFVRSFDSERLDVVFVDPDAPEETPDSEESSTASSSSVAEAPRETFEERFETAELSLQSIVLDARGTLGEVEFLRESFRQVEEQVLAEEWRQRKEVALQRTTEPDFWNLPERFSVLGLAEYMDRIEAGLDTAGSLLRRLTGSRPRDRKHFPADLVARLAEQLYLIDSACRGLANSQPRDAFLQVRACCDAGTDATVCNAFASRLAEMYKSWAKKRRMQLEVLEETGGGDSSEPYRIVMAVSGFAAFPVLEPESGLHVLETPQDEKSFNRARVEVRVVAQPEEPAGHTPGALRAQAARMLAFDSQTSSTNAANAHPTLPTNSTIVRRYREEPSPLVRDSRRQWRTGRLDRVLEGDFDIML